MKLFIFTSLLLFIISPAQGAVIIKIHNNQALIHLEGLKTKKGSYFEALDIYGNSKGLVQIKQVGNEKAIGVLKLGKIGLKWSLEPKSRRWATSKFRKYKTVLIQKQKLKRKQLAQQKRRKDQRQIASYNREEEYLMDDREQFSQQKRRKAQRQMAPYNREEEYLMDDRELSFSDSDNYNSNIDSYNSESKKDTLLMGPSNSANITVGLQPLGTFNFMKISPKKSKDNILMKGLGYGGRFFIETSMNKSLSFSGYMGYQRFASESENECGKSKRCSLKVDYVSAGLSLKFSPINKKSLKLFAGLNGSILYPLGYINKANISKESFGLHGTLGPILGANLLFGNFTIPININVDVIIPPTVTAMTVIANFSLGVGYKF